MADLTTIGEADNADRVEEVLRLIALLPRLPNGLPLDTVRYQELRRQLTRLLEGSCYYTDLVEAQIAQQRVVQQQRP